MMTHNDYLSTKTVYLSDKLEGLWGQDIPIMIDYPTHTEYSNLAYFISEYDFMLKHYGNFIVSDYQSGDVYLIAELVKMKD